MGGGEPTRKRGDEEGEAAGEGSRVERGEEKGHLQEEEENEEGGGNGKEGEPWQEGRE